MSSAILDRPVPPRVQPPPPEKGNGDGGGGGGGGDGGGPSFGSSGPPFSVSRTGLYILIGSIVMLFSGFLAVYVVLRFGSPEWHPKELPPLPGGLWLSTALIAISSVTAMAWGRTARRSDRRATMRWLVATFVLGIAFCVTQAVLWRHLLDRGYGIGSHVSSAMFYAITIVHFVHVIGGLFYHLVCIAGVARRLIDRALVERLGNCAIYWHFVGILWYVLFFALYLV
jgi:cytochrome c oxidase subunit III